MGPAPSDSVSLEPPIVRSLPILNLPREAKRFDGVPLEAFLIPASTFKGKMATGFPGCVGHLAS